MSHTGKTDTICNNPFSHVASPHPHLAGLAEAALWVRRHREPIEATITITLAMTTPVLAAVATLQPSLSA